jgi:hypothetical protein
VSERLHGKLTAVFLQIDFFHRKKEVKMLERSFAVFFKERTRKYTEAFFSAKLNWCEIRKLLPGSVCLVDQAT